MTGKKNKLTAVPIFLAFLCMGFGDAVGPFVEGAILPPVMGLVADMTNMTIGFFVPLAGIGYIFLVALKNLKLKT